VARTASVVHGSFSVERRYKVTPSRVFAAFANEASKRRWFAGGEGGEIEEFAVDFREGGRELARFRQKSGADMRNDTVYHDIVPNQRIVFAYDMSLAGRRISVSLGTVELTASGGGTRLLYTEQGAFFEDAGGARLREQGWKELLLRLEQELALAG
jgi:uncharacterized protein YndB with AHSA1/START domain